MDEKREQRSPADVRGTLLLVGGLIASVGAAIWAGNLGAGLLLFGLLTYRLGESR